VERYDSKDEMAIVSSDQLDMLTKTAEDAARLSNFTGDEHHIRFW
jgi:hypothetical protein